MILPDKASTTLPATAGTLFLVIYSFDKFAFVFRLFLGK
jgi:hypothetical protein